MSLKSFGRTIFSFRSAKIAAGTVFVTAYVRSYRHTTTLDLPDSDPLLNTTVYARFNSLNSVTNKYLATRTVPLEQIKPELLEDNGKLLELFAKDNLKKVKDSLADEAARKAAQRWERRNLKQPETVVKPPAEHWTILARTENSIIFRGKTTNSGLQTLIEDRVDVDKKGGTVEFTRKDISCHPNNPGLPVQGPPLGPVFHWLTQTLHMSLVNDHVALLCLRRGVIGD